MIKTTQDRLNDVSLSVTTTDQRTRELASLQGRYNMELQAFSIYARATISLIFRDSL